MLLGDSMANKRIYLFIGDEKLIIKNKINHLIGEIKADDYNVSSYDLDEVELSNAIQDAQTSPFLSEYKVIVLKNPVFLTNEKSVIEHNIDMFLQYLKNPLETTYLIIDATGLKLSEKKAVTKEVKKYAEERSTSALSDVEIRGWLTRMLSKEGVLIDENAIDTFINVVGKNLEVAKHEIDKLIYYVGKGNIVTSQIIHNVCIKTLETDVYALSNLILNGEKKKVIQKYHRLVKDGNDPYYLFSLISRTIRVLYLSKIILQEKQGKDYLAQVLGVSSGRAFYIEKDTKKISAAQLEKFLHQAGDLDYKIKSGQIEVQAGLELFLFEL